MWRGWFSRFGGGVVLGAAAAEDGGMRGMVDSLYEDGGLRVREVLLVGLAGCLGDEKGVYLEWF